MFKKGDIVIIDNTSSRLHNKVAVVLKDSDGSNVWVRFSDTNIRARDWHISKYCLRYVNVDVLIDLSLQMNDRQWFDELTDRFKKVTSDKKRQ